MTMAKADPATPCFEAAPGKGTKLELGVGTEPVGACAGGIGNN
jgi:hypothetical protein